MAKRNYIQEIFEIKTRSGERPPYITAFLRIREVRSLIENTKEPNMEYLRYCSVGLVACLEAYFRALIKELIDSGEPFQKRCSRFDRIKFNFEIVAAIHGKNITLGDIISHLIPLNNKNDINNSMSILLDADFFEEIKNVREHWPWEPIKAATIKPIIPDPASIFKNIDKTFELRHTVCHEFGHSSLLSIEEATLYIDSIELFLSATNFIAMKLLFKDVPDTQQKRNIYFGAKYQETNEKMSAILKIAEKAFSDNRLKDFSKLQSLWEKYREKDAEFITNHYEGGTISPQIHAQRLEHLTKKRIIEIKEIIESERP